MADEDNSREVSHVQIEWEEDREASEQASGAESATEAAQSGSIASSGDEVNALDMKILSQVFPKQSPQKLERVLRKNSGTLSKSMTELMRDDGEASGETEIPNDPESAGVASGAKRKIDKDDSDRLGRKAARIDSGAGATNLERQQILTNLIGQGQEDLPPAEEESSVELVRSPSSNSQNEPDTSFDGAGGERDTAGTSTSLMDADNTGSELPELDPGEVDEQLFMDNPDLPGPSGEAMTDSCGTALRLSPKTQGLADFLSGDEQENLQTILQMFPDIDPHYVVEEIAQRGKSAEILVDQLSRDSGYPKLRTRMDKERREQRREEFLNPEIFDPGMYLRIFDNPETYFMDQTRVVSQLYKEHAIVQLMNDFPNTRKDYLQRVLEDNGNHYLPAHKAVAESESGSGAKKRKARKGIPNKKRRRNVAFGPQYLHTGDREEPEKFPEEIEEIFFRELQYVRYEDTIRGHLETQRAEREAKLENARQEKLLEECGCCYNDECLPEDMVPCSKNRHKFCRNCVRQHAETQVGEGYHRIKCLSDDCDEEMGLNVLGEILRPNIVDLILRRSQEHEIQNAQLENMESCPFCHFAMIIDNREDRVFRCQNPECLKESCRECHELSHIPLKCNEVEKADETRMRTFVENKMAEAMIRKCPSCGNRMVKSDGCNKMRCPCGTAICYVCNESLDPRNPYVHFDRTGMGFFAMRRDGADATNVNRRGCPLHTSINQVHADVAEKAGETAKETYMQQHPEMKEKKHVQVQELVDRANDPRQAYIEMMQQPRIDVHDYHGAPWMMRAEILVPAADQPGNQQMRAEVRARVEQQHEMMYQHMRERIIRRIQQVLQMNEQQLNMRDANMADQIRQQLLQLNDNVQQNFGNGAQDEGPVNRERMLRIREPLMQVEQLHMQVRQDIRRVERLREDLRVRQRHFRVLLANIEANLNAFDDQFTPEVAQGFRDRLQQIRDVPDLPENDVAAQVGSLQEKMEQITALRQSINGAVRSEADIKQRELSLQNQQLELQMELHKLQHMKERSGLHKEASQRSLHHRRRLAVPSEGDRSSLHHHRSQATAQKQRTEYLLGEIQRRLNDHNENELIYEMIQIRESLDRWDELPAEERYECTRAVDLLLARARMDQHGPVPLAPPPFAFQHTPRRQTVEEASGPILQTNVEPKQEVAEHESDTDQQSSSANTNKDNRDVTENSSAIRLPNSANSADDSFSEPQNSAQDETPGSAPSAETLIKAEVDDMEAQLNQEVDQEISAVPEEVMAKASEREKNKLKDHQKRIEKMKNHVQSLKKQVEQGRPFNKQLKKQQQSLLSEKSRLANLIAEIIEQNDQNPSSPEPAPRAAATNGNTAHGSSEIEAQLAAKKAVMKIENLRKDSQRLSDAVTDAQRAIARSRTSEERRTNFGEFQRLMRQRDEGLAALHDAEEEALKQGVSENELRGGNRSILHLSAEEITNAAAEAREVAARAQNDRNQELANVQSRQETGSPGNLLVLGQLIQELNISLQRYRSDFLQGHDGSSLLAATTTMNILKQLIGLLRIVVENHPTSPAEITNLFHNQQVFGCTVIDPRVTNLIQLSGDLHLFIGAAHALRQELEQGTERFPMPDQFLQHPERMQPSELKKITADSRFLTRRISREKERVRDIAQQIDQQRTKEAQEIEKVEQEIQTVQEQIAQAQEEFRTAVKEDAENKARCNHIEREMEEISAQEQSLRDQLVALAQHRDRLTTEHRKLNSAGKVESARAKREALESQWNILQGNLKALTKAQQAQQSSSNNSAVSSISLDHSQQAPPDPATQETSTVELVAEQPSKRASEEEEEDLLKLMREVKRKGLADKLKNQLRALADKKDGELTSVIQKAPKTTGTSSVEVVDLGSEDEADKPEVLFDTRPGLSEERPIVIEPDSPGAPEVSTVEIVPASPPADSDEIEDDGEAHKSVKKPVSVFRCTQCGFHTTAERIYLLHSSLHTPRAKLDEENSISDVVSTGPDSEEGNDTNRLGDPTVQQRTLQASLKREFSEPVISEPASISQEKRSRSSSNDDTNWRLIKCDVDAPVANAGGGVSPPRALIDPRHYRTVGAVVGPMPPSPQGVVVGGGNQNNPGQNAHPGMIQINIHFPGDHPHEARAQIQQHDGGRRSNAGTPGHIPDDIEHMDFEEAM